MRQEFCFPRGSLKLGIILWHRLCFVPYETLAQHGSGAIFPNPSPNQSCGFVPPGPQPAPGPEPWAPSGISEGKGQHLPCECRDVPVLGSLFHAAAWFPMARGSGTDFLSNSPRSKGKQKRNDRKHREKINGEKEQRKARRKEGRKATVNSSTWNSCWFPKKIRVYILGSSGGTTRQIWDFFQLFLYLGSNAFNLKGTKPPLPSKSRDSPEIGHDFYLFLISENE